MKTPKLYWTDTGLAAHLAGLTSAVKSKEDIPGALLENLVLTQVLAWRETAVPRPEIHYWRTHGGLEVDFVIESGRRLLPVEVKAARRVLPADAKGLDAFLGDHPATAPFGILLYGGTEIFALTDRIAAVPLDCLWGT